MRTLNLNELTTKQKLGMTMTAHVGKLSDVDSAIELIKAHSLGCVWVIPTINGQAEAIRRIKEAADYPVLIMCDAESGIGSHKIGRHNAIGCTGSEELAYVFGKVTALTAKKMGYNVICDPVLDMVTCNFTCGGTVRSIGKDKYEVTRLAAAEARGFHDCGVLTVAKHYPGKAKSGRFVDSHMGETLSDETAEELLDYNLYPYVQLNNQGLIDGVMLKHARFPNIDPEYPASLSPKLIKILRDQGFEGFAMTDALSMMGVVAKFGKKGCIGLSVGNAADLALPYNENSNYEPLEALCEAYEKGIITDERLNEAAQRVLDAQAKTLMEPKFTEITDEDLKAFARLNTDSVFERTDEGIAKALDRNGRYYFAILSESEVDVNNPDAIQVDTMDKKWFNPYAIADKLKELFPNSIAKTICEFPSRESIVRILDESLEYEDTIFITFYNSQAYVGTEHFTSRITSLITAMQVSNRISTVVHFGNPYLLEELPHIPRVLIGTTAADNIIAALEVLAGQREAKGVLTYDIELK